MLLLTIPPANTVANSFSGILAISESIVAIHRLLCRGKIWSFNKKSIGDDDDDDGSNALCNADDDDDDDVD
jgi:hypothetical protein